MMESLDKCAVHTITMKHWDLATACRKFSAAGINGVGVWRQWLEGRSLAESKQILDDHGMTPVSLVRGGFFTAKSPELRQKAIDENKVCLDEAAAIGADQVVLVVGADPEIPLLESRKHILDGIAACVSHAKATGVKLAIEPLHPVYADCRSAVNTIGHANDIIDQTSEEWVGIACDVYHVYWDPQLEQEIRRAGKRICGFHVCDWRTPTIDLLNDRGLMGEGCIDIPYIRGLVEATGFSGFNEVEIFSERLWQLDSDEYLRQIVEAYKAHV